MNDLFPGLPDYTGPKQGFFALLHHDQLFEWSDDVQERIGYVKQYKPKHEVDTRLRHMLYLPQTVVSELYLAHAEYEEACTQSWVEYVKVCDRSRAKFEKARDQAWAEYKTARDQAYAEFVKVITQSTPAVLAFLEQHLEDEIC